MLDALLNDSLFIRILILPSFTLIQKSGINFNLLVRRTDIKSNENSQTIPIELKNPPTCISCVNDRYTLNNKTNVTKKIPNRYYVKNSQLKMFDTRIVKCSVSRNAYTRKISQ